MALRLSTGLRNQLLSSGSFKEILADGVIRLFPGVQPVSADDAESATHLVQISLGSGTFTAGQPGNGLEFGTAAGGILAKNTGEVWSGVATGSGTAGWFRFYANDLATGAATDKARFDGSIATSGAQLNMSSTAITAGATTTIDSFTITFPAS